MTASANRWKLGLFVTLSTVLAVGSLMWLGISQLQRRTTPAYFYFNESVSGLVVGSPVEFLGVEVGRVEGIVPAPDRRHIEVVAGIFVDTLEAWGISPSEFEHRIEGQSFVPEDIRGQLVTRALTSTSFIEIDIFDPQKHPEPTYNFPIPWETIHTVPSTIKSFERGLMDALERWPEIADRAASVLRHLDEGLAEVDFGRLNDDLSTVLRDADEMVVAMRSSPIVDGESATVKKFDATLDELRALLDELRGREGAVARFVESFEGAADAIAGDFEGSDIPAAVRSVEAAGTGFEATAQSMTQLVGELRSTLLQLDAALHSVQSLADLLARDPAALLYGKSPSRTFRPR